MSATFRAASGFDRLKNSTLSKRVDVKAVAPDRLRHAHSAITARVKGIADYAVLLESIEKYLAVVWELSPKSGHGGTGYIAVLPLNQQGFEGVKDGTLNTSAPAGSYLAKTYEEIAAMYVWVIVTPGMSIGGAISVLDKYSSDEYGHIPVLCKAVHDRSRRLFERIGFSELNPDSDYPKVMHLDRPDKKGGDQTVLDKVYGKRTGSKLSISVCSNLNDLMQVFAIRSATYMAEQNCPFDEEFDGNDFCGTHLIGSIDGEPVSTIRIRYFSNFAKIERLAVTSKHRGGSYALDTAKAALQFCHRKGYTTFYGHSSDRVAPLWQKLGFEHVADRPEFEFSQVRYRELVLKMPPHENPLRIGTDPYVLIRPEGDWDRPGVLDPEQAGRDDSYDEHERKAA